MNNKYSDYEKAIRRLDWALTLLTLVVFSMIGVNIWLIWKLLTGRLH